MMIAEIAAGTVFNSMAPLADGWHMSTNAGALGVAAIGLAMNLVSVLILGGHGGEEENGEFTA